MMRPHFNFNACGALLLTSLLCGCMILSHPHPVDATQGWDARVASIAIGTRTPSAVVSDLRTLVPRYRSMSYVLVIPNPAELPDKWAVPVPSSLTDSTLRTVLETVAIGVDRTCLFAGSVAFLLQRAEYRFLPISFEGRVSDSVTGEPVVSVAIDPAAWLLPPRFSINANGEFHATVFVEFRYFSCDGVAIFRDQSLRRHVPVRFLSDGYAPVTVNITVSGDEHSFRVLDVILRRESVVRTAHPESAD